MWKVFVFCAVIAAVRSALVWEERQADDSDVQKIVKFAAKSINDRSNSIFMRRVSKVASAKRQVFFNPDSSSAYTYIVKFVFAQTKCNKYSSPEKVAACDVYADRDEVCTVEAVENFTGGRFLRNFQCNAKISITKRAGGVHPVDNPEIYVDTAVRALSMANAELKNVRVVSAKTQVVAGQKIMMEVVGDSLNGKQDTQCSIDVWSRPWLADESGFQVTKFECGKRTFQKDNSIAKRHGGQIQTIERPEIYVDTAVRALSMANSELKNIRVVSAKTQVVAGQKIMLEVVGDSLNGKQDTQCSIDVWSRPWLADESGFQVTKFVCGKATPKKDKGLTKRAGGIQAVSDPTIFTDTAIRALSMSNAALKNVRVVSAKTQIVAGQIIMMELVGDAAEKEDTTCNVNVWSRPWLKNEDSFKVTYFSCRGKDQSKSNVLTKRARGGIEDVSDPSKFRDTALRAMAMSNAYLANVHVISAKTQVVAGQRIYLEIVGDSEGKKDTICSLDVWSRPWLSNGDGFKVNSFSCKKNLDAKSERALGERTSCGGCVSDVTDDLDNYMGYYIRAFGMANTNMDIENTKIEKVQRQVVAGIRYIMTVKTSEAGKPRRCTVSFVIQAWMAPNDMKNVKFDCKPIVE